MRISELSTTKAISANVVVTIRTAETWRKPRYDIPMAFRRERQFIFEAMVDTTAHNTENDSTVGNREGRCSGPAQASRARFLRHSTRAHHRATFRRCSEDLAHHRGDRAKCNQVEHFGLIDELQVQSWFVHHQGSAEGDQYSG